MRNHRDLSIFDLLRQTFPAELVKRLTRLLVIFRSSGAQRAVARSFVAVYRDGGEEALLRLLAQLAEAKENRIRRQRSAFAQSQMDFRARHPYRSIN